MRFPLFVALLFLISASPFATADDAAKKPAAEDEPTPTLEDADAMIAGNPVQREKAARWLARIGGTKAATRLLELTKDGDWGVQVAAIRALGDVPHKPALAELRQLAVRGEIRRVRIAAARALSKLDADGAAGKLAGVMRKIKKEARLPYIEAVGILGGKVAADALAAQLRAPDPDHRLAAAQALVRLRTGQGGLINLLKDKRVDIRYTAAVALAGIDDDKAREALMTFLRKPRKGHESYVLRRIGRRAAATNPVAIEKVVAREIEKTKKPLYFLEVASYGRMAGAAEAARKHLMHRDALTAAYAFEVAALRGGTLAAEAVTKALKSRDRRLRYAAARSALAAAEKAERIDIARTLLAHKLGDVTEVAIRFAVNTKLKPVLDSLWALANGETAAKKEWLARSAATVALGRVGGKGSYKRLLELSNSRDWWQRGAAFEGLYHTKLKQVVPLLIENFNDKHPAVRLTVRRNLKYMTGKHYPQQRFYADWWKRVERKWRFRAPDGVITQLKRDGYAVRKVREILSGTDIVAVKGRWDKVELILQDLRVKHQAVRAQELKVFGVTPKQIVLVNCEGSVDSRVTQLLQWMVSCGGYMATTDWALVNATTKTFPQVVGGYVRQSTGNDVVVVEPGEPNHPSVQSVFQDFVDLQWWLEIQAFPIKIEDPIRSRVLVDSLQMLARYGASAMMVEFDAGLGKVLHSTSHFYLQKEGFAHASSVQERRVFAADNLGLTFPEIRALDEKRAFDNVNNTTPISRSYSMFRLLVNFITEKRNIDLGFASRTDEIVRDPRENKKGEKKPDEKKPEEKPEEAG